MREEILKTALVILCFELLLGSCSNENTQVPEKLWISQCTRGPIKMKVTDFSHDGNGFGTFQIEIQSSRSGSVSIELLKPEGVEFLGDVGPFFLEKGEKVRKEYSYSNFHVQKSAVVKVRQFDLNGQNAWTAQVVISSPFGRLHRESKLELGPPSNGDKIEIGR